MRDTFMALRYALPNVVTLAMIAAFLAGNPWIWVVFVGSLVVGGLFDEAIGDNVSRSDPTWRLFYDLNLFAALPLLIVLTYLLLRIMVTFPPIGFFELPAFQVLVNFIHAMARDWAVYPAAVIASGYLFALAGSTVAHELGHRIDNRLALLWARMLHAFSLNPTYEVYHVHYHHRNVGTYSDPSTGRRGESAYAFLLRSISNQSRLAWWHEVRHLQRKGLSLVLHNRVLSGIACTIVLIGAAGVTAQAAGVIALLTAIIFARILHEMVNYIQHYGLVRIDGQPIEARHSWDSYRIISNALQYNLPRHADHHRFATRPFWNLESTDAAPRLPFGYETMVLFAFIPPLWNRVLNPVLAQWDDHFASKAEREFIEEHCPSKKALIRSRRPCS